MSRLVWLVEAGKPALQSRSCASLQYHMAMLGSGDFVSLNCHHRTIRVGSDFRVHRHLGAYDLPSVWGVVRKTGSCWDQPVERRIRLYPLASEFLPARTSSIREAHFPVPSSIPIPFGVLGCSLDHCPYTKVTTLVFVDPVLGYLL